MAMQNFRHWGFEHLFGDDTPRGVSPAMAPKSKRMLFALAHASEVADMAVFPGWRVHPTPGRSAWLLEPHRHGQLASDLPVSAGDAWEVDLVDDHEG
jgi:hypothetical protein